SIFSIKKFDERSFVNDIQKIVQATTKVFSHIPYERYLFLVDFTGDSFGGLEHLNSTHCLASVFRLEPPQEYHELLTLFSHEFFHAWNVKRMRPTGLGPFDYSKETYSKSLWISEGVTSYYDDLLLRRAGIYSTAEYLEAFTTNIDMIRVLPGAKWQSAEEASFDAWIKHYRQNENSPNVLSSYYLQGAIIGWMLDMEIRRVTQSEKSLDDVMRTVYEKSFVRENRGFSDEEFQAACEKVGGPGVKTIFEDRVKGRENVDFEKYLGYAGLQVSPKKYVQGQGFLGIKTKEDSGKTIVSNILSAYAGELCGLSPFDEIISVDGVRIDKSRLAFYMSNRKPDDRIRLMIARLGAIMELDARLSEKPILEFRIWKKETATEDEKHLFAKWIGDSWNRPIVYEDHVRSPVRANQLDYI
ncbi:MAG: hypothetical protein OK439_00925, partial [Thaumarchaeota archaeon]|nr:hypothetical protein [Nitrososphaerota archaeon]